MSQSHNPIRPIGPIRPIFVPYAGTRGRAPSKAGIERKIWSRDWIYGTRVEMDFKGLIEALEKFFLDIIGTLVPGIAALIAAVTLCSVSFETLRVPEDVRVYSPALWLALAYVSGHAVISVGQRWLIPLIDFLRSLPGIGAIVRRLFGKALPYDRPPAEPDDPLMQAFFATLRRRDPEFAHQIEPATHAETWRDAALSIAPEQTALINRFTFISLLNLGMATVFFLVPLVWLGLILVESTGLGLHVQAFSIAAFLLWIPAILLLERYFTFARSSFFVPFSMAAAKLMNGSDHKEQLDGRLELDVKLTKSQEREARSEK